MKARIFASTPTSTWTRTRNQAAGAKKAGGENRGKRTSLGGLDGTSIGGERVDISGSPLLPAPYPPSDFLPLSCFSCSLPPCLPLSLLPLLHHLPLQPSRHLPIPSQPNLHHLETQPSGQPSGPLRTVRTLPLPLASPMSTNYTKINAIGGTIISSSTIIAAAYLLWSLARQGRGKLRVRLLLGMVISDLILG